MPSGMTPNYSVRPAQPGDRERIYDIHRAALGPYVAELWGWDEAWQAEAFARRFDPQSIRVIVVGEQVVGFFELNEDCDGAILSKIEIEPGWQQRGLGTSIISDVLASARARGQALRLQVFKINNRARALYRRLGFCETDETATHVQMFAPARA